VIFNLTAAPASFHFDEVFFQPAMTVLHDYCRQEQTNGIHRAEKSTSGPILRGSLSSNASAERCLGGLKTSADIIGLDHETLGEILRQTDSILFLL